MTPDKKALLVLARAGMEMSWRYAWVGFLTLLICHRVFPLAEAAGAFVMAIILNRLPVNHNWRLYQSLLLQAAGFVFFSLLILYRLWYETFSFFSVTWLSALFQDPKSLSHKFTFLLILFCLLLIWRGGRTLVKSPMDYDYVCIQFDKGIGLFILLLLVKFLIQEKADILVDGLALGFLVCAFLIFSLLSIFLARKQPDVEKSFMTGYQGIGITLSLISLLVLFGSGAIFFFYPILTQVADSSLTIVKSIAEPLVPVLVTILLFLFSPGKIRLRGNIDTNNPELPADLVNTPISNWMVTLLSTVSTGLLVAIGIIALFFFGLFIRYLLRLLLKRNTQNMPKNMALSWIRYVVGWFIWLPVHIRQGLISLLKRAESAASVYAGLLRWGHRSGLRLLPGETSAEYGDRLMQHFPDLRNEITWIIDAFNREIYGQMATDRNLLFRLRSAQRRMRRLRYWPSRIRICFSQ
jgi:hypothetical protein